MPSFAHCPELKRVPTKVVTKININQDILLVESKNFDPRTLHNGLGPRYGKMKQRKCGITLTPNLGGPHSKQYSSKFKRPIFKLGSKLEFESRVH
jgi:hypothetical protein